MVKIYCQQDICLMKIKVPFAYPLWLASLFTDLKIYPMSFQNMDRLIKIELRRTGSSGSRTYYSGKRQYIDLFS